MIGLTRGGQLVALGAVAAAVGGRLLGLDEVTILGVAAMLLVVVSLLWVARPLPPLHAEVRVEPGRVQVDASCAATLALGPAGSRRCPPLHVSLPLAGERSVGLEVPALASGELVRFERTLRTDRRGIFHLDPPRVVRSDPFGLSEQRGVLPVQPARLVVLPLIELVAPPVGADGDDPLGAVSRSHIRAASGEEFASLRRYVPGDDLRQVHWPTSARVDDLVVRREERPWQRRCTVLVDVRPSSHRDGSIEALVSAAASVLTASTRRGDAVRLTTTAGLDSGYGSGRGHLDRLLDELAALAVDDVDRVVAHAHPAGGGGAVVLLTTPWAPADLSAARGRTARFVLPGDEPFRDAWARRMGPPVGRRRRPGRRRVAP